MLTSHKIHVCIVNRVQTAPPHANWHSAVCAFIASFPGRLGPGNEASAFRSVTYANAPGHVDDGNTYKDSIGWTRFLRLK